MKIIEEHVAENVKCFERVETGECFMHASLAYIKMDFIKVEPCGHQGSTNRLGGYNAVRLSNGQPGSFQDDTSVRLMPKAALVLKFNKY